MGHLHSLDVFDSPPHKRRRLSIHEARDDDIEASLKTEYERELGMRQLISEELDLEIAIRQRLLDTIDSRITWALMLQETLTSDASTPASDVVPDDFQDAAMDALSAAELSSAFLFDREESTFNESEPPSRLFSPITTPQRERMLPKVRPMRITALKHHPHKKLLYIRLPPSQIAVDGQIAVLTCTDCARTQFSSLQGLLNHARLVHGIEWASHDACIAACAVLIPSNDYAEKERVEAEGVEVPWGGTVVGLQRLFERAVGVNVPSPLLPKELGAAVSAPTTSTLLSRTLGLHADSPALAPFLGRTPKRRCIHVHEEDAEVDILSVSAVPKTAEKLAIHKCAHPWRMTHPHRSNTRSDLDFILDAQVLIDNSADNTATFVIPGSTTSRFHITARVRITDRSLYISPDRRVGLSIPPSHTHRWMLSLTSPSYSIPLASFLIRLTVMAVVPSDNTQRQPCTVDKVPFYVQGTSSEPFLAKVVMEWASGGRMEVEHWIDLDRNNSTSSVSGSEQLLDVELDKGTRLLPVPSGPSAPIPSLEREPAEITRQYVASHSDFEDGYAKVLQSLLPRVPMTMKDKKNRSPVQLPYKLVPSPAHLLALVPGRRKAIEWGRARALQELYVQHKSTSADLITLTVGDVYSFLEDSGNFPRPSVKGEAPIPSGKGRKENESTPSPVDEPCPVCGIKKRFHPAIAATTRMKEPVHETVAWVCDIVPPHELERGSRIPMVDLTKIFGGGLESVLYSGGAPGETQVLTCQTIGKFPQVLTPWRHTPREIVLISPPDLTLAIHKSVGILRLSHYPELPLPSLKEHRTGPEVEEALAPSALLAAVLKPFISVLVRSAVNVARHDIVIANGGVVAGQTDAMRRKRGRKVECVLTPGHILRGLSLPNFGGHAESGATLNPSGGVRVTTNLKDVLGICLARIGVPLEYGRSSMPASDIFCGRVGEEGIIKGRR